MTFLREPENYPTLPEMSQTKKAPTTAVETIKLFAYGTLKTDQPESGMFRSKLIESVPAKMIGILYQIQEGYPILKTPPANALGRATKDLQSDWKLGNELNLQTAPQTTGAFQWIEGELLTFPMENGILDSMDAWEGFSPGKKTFYQRILTQAFTTDGTPHLCWAYTCEETPKAPTKRIHSASWIRPKGLKH